MKTAIITGASQGLGLVIARTFSDNGWQVIGTGRSARPDTLDQTIQYEQFDASDAEACTDFWQRFKDKATADEVCLVNNAGSYVEGGLLDTKAADYDKQMQSNYFSAVYMTRGLIDNCHKARIINIVSNSALNTHSSQSAYGAAKAAEKHFFQSLQKEFPASKYRITNLYPSDIASSGPNSNAINPVDLAGFIVQQADNKSTYYLPDVTVYPTKE
jgi:NAD(P)-dependent dehydrogenase (short-subunit alcohol dehydrogenase family)